MNRLRDEKSPYLQQHAKDPVDWYPWSEEAFSKAELEQRPIFLSIGYSTCHWCHVMEEESFSDPEVARELNRIFVCVKVDRQERPEIDSLYVEFAQHFLTKEVGWPLNLILTPDLKPFFAVTYLPPRTNTSMTGLTEVCTHIDKLWNGGKRESLLSQAEELYEALNELHHVELPVAHDLKILGRGFLDGAREQLYAEADPVYGGTKGAPKFPMAYQYQYLMRCGFFKEDTRAIFYTDKTLEKLRLGGIHDHLGGGFSRYSVDERWCVPHFEKMLIDNAVLLRTYIEAWQLIGNPYYERVSLKILDFFMNKMRGEHGGFYAAEDADINGIEGGFYTWNYFEIKNILGREMERFCELFDLKPEGHVEGRCVLFQQSNEEEMAKAWGWTQPQFNAWLESIFSRLARIQSDRPQPIMDDQVTVSSNGLAIKALSQAYLAFGNREVLQAAQSAAHFLHKTLREEDGRMMRRYRDGEPRFRANLEDYAYLCSGLLSLFDASGEVKWLNWTRELVEIIEKDFKGGQGIYYQTDTHNRYLILRKRSIIDGAEPSGNAVHAENLVKLLQLTHRDEYRERVQKYFSSVMPVFLQYPAGFTYSAMALMSYFDEGFDNIVIALNESRDHQEEIRELLGAHFIPHANIIWRREDDPELLVQLPWVEELKPIGGKTTFYRCQNQKCREPLSDWNQIREALSKGGWRHRGKT